MAAGTPCAKAASEAVQIPESFSLHMGSTTVSQPPSSPHPARLRAQPEGEGLVGAEGDWTRQEGGGGGEEREGGGGAAVGCELGEDERSRLGTLRLAELSPSNFVDGADFRWGRCLPTPDSTAGHLETNHIRNRMCL